MTFDVGVIDELLDFPQQQKNTKKTFKNTKNNLIEITCLTDSHFDFLPWCIVGHNIIKSSEPRSFPSSHTAIEV